MLRRSLVLCLAFVAISFGACNCDEELYGFPGDLSGVLCAPDSGRTAPDLSVTVTDAEGQEVESTTDATGLFRAESLAAGTAAIVIHDPAGDREGTIEILAGEEVRFNDDACRPPPPPTGGSISGCACDDGVGAWVEGANVYVVTTAGALFVTGTDAVGCFVLDNVTPGSQTLKIEKGSFYAEHIVEVAAGADVQVPTPASCDAPPPPPESGAIEGRVCAPDGTTWLADATVSVERPDGSRAEDTTDIDGNYTLTGVPAGQQTVNVTKGSFTSSLVVNVIADQTTVVPESECALPLDLTLAVVSGYYDHVEDVLNDIGVDPGNVTTYGGTGFSSPWVEDLLEDYAVLSQYDIVFLNCGLDEGDFLSPLTANAVAVANLRQFVTEGGSVYASDWAYSVVERAWNDRIDFAGNDDSIGGSKIGTTTAALTGTIVDSALAAAMGSSSIELHYPLGAWVPMQGVATNVTQYIIGNAPTNTGTLANVPHTVGFNAGAGRVIYTSFHQEPGISAAQERVLQLLMFEL